MKSKDGFLPPDAQCMGISRLYHYQAFNEVRLRSILQENQIYFSNPADFNDPWDCRPWYAVPGTDRERRDLIAKLKTAHQKRFPNRTRVERRKAAKSLLGTPTLLKSEIEKLSTSMWTQMQNRYRVYCLTENPVCPLMWGHYADHHRGVCLEFDASNEIVGAAMKVEYCKEYPTFNFFDGYELLPFVAKSHHWNYEREFRLVSEEIGAALSAATLKTRNGIFDLPANSIKSIIVGSEASIETHKIVRDLATELDGSVSVVRAVRSADKY